MARRAINAEQKAERRQAILVAASEMLRSERYDAIGIKQIAESIGLTKAAVYLYFDTKESLFLSLYQQELDLTFGQLAGQLSDSASLKPDAFASLLADLFNRSPVFSVLTGMLHTVLEQNITPENAKQFKAHVAEQTAKVAGLLESKVEGLTQGDGLLFLLRMHQCLIGVWHTAHPSPVIQALLNRPEFEMFAIDYRSELEICAQSILSHLLERPHA